MSIRFTVVCGSVLLLLTGVHSFEHQSLKLDNGHYELKDHMPYTGEREKRAYYPQNPFLFTRGLHALNQLLHGAKRVWTPSRKFRKYEKFGDEKAALSDFYSIKPENIEATKNKFQLGHIQTEGQVYHGTVGDREVRLLLNGDGYSNGRPVLDVIESRSSSLRNSKDQPYVDRFIYKDKTRSEQKIE